MPALNVNTLVQDKEYLIHSSLYHPKGPIKYIGKTPHGYLKFISHDTGDISFDPNTTQIYNVNATDYPAITHSAPAFKTPEALAAAANEYYETPFSERGVLHYTNKQKIAMREYRNAHPAPASSSSTAATTTPAPASSSSTAATTRPALTDQWQWQGWNEEEDYTRPAPASSSSTAATTRPAPASSSSTSSPPLSNAAKISYMQNHYSWMANDYEEPENQYSAMGHGGKRYTTHKQRKHKSRKSRKGRKSQKRRRS